MPNNLITIAANRWRSVTDQSAVVTCPNCRREFTIVNRVIDGKGIVGGIVRCPWNIRNNPHLKEQMIRDKASDCDFHGEIRLDNWPVSKPLLTQPPEPEAPKQEDYTE